MTNREWFTEHFPEHTGVKMQDFCRGAWSVLEIVGLESGSVAISRNGVSDVPAIWPYDCLYWYTDVRFFAWAIRISQKLETLELMDLLEENGIQLHGIPTEGFTNMGFRLLCYWKKTSKLRQASRLLEK